MYAINRELAVKAAKVLADWPYQTIAASQLSETEHMLLSPWLRDQVDGDIYLSRLGGCSLVLSFYDWQGREEVVDITHLLPLSAVEALAAA